MPLLPVDYDPRHGNAAHPALQFDQHLVPKDGIAIVNMTEDGLWQFALPEMPVVIEARFDDGRVLASRPPIDTVLIEPSIGRVEITVRHAFPRGRGRTLLRELRVNLDE